jgi:hypothetical protein
MDTRHQPLANHDPEVSGTTDQDADTEGHALRPQYPAPPAAAGRVGPGEQRADEGDTEGHLLRGSVPAPPAALGRPRPGEQ